MAGNTRIANVDAEVVAARVDTWTVTKFTEKRNLVTEQEGESPCSPRFG
jgi:hypothetical protein